MKIILDIDQDFFFYPPLYGSLEEVKELNHLNQKLIYRPIDIINRYNIRKKPYKIFKNHNEVALDIISKNYKNHEVKLIHLDAHHDLTIKNNNEVVMIKYHEITIANWINYLIFHEILSSIDYIYYNIEENQKILKAWETEILWSEFSFDKHTFKGPIDYVYYTLSSEWCPENNLVDEFKEEML